MNVRNMILQYSSIYNKNDKTLFIEDVYGHLKEKDILSNVRILNQIGKVEFFLEKDLNQFALRDIVYLFERCGWVSAGTFAVRKSFIADYLDWSVKSGKVEYETLNTFRALKNTDLSGKLIFNVSHFKDFQELVSANKSVVLSEMYNDADETTLIMEEIITYLSWFRLTLDQITSLKRENVDLKNKIIKVQDKIITIPESIMSRFEICLAAEGIYYKWHDRYLYREYVNSPFVIRSTKVYQLSTNAVQQLLTKYSALSDKLSLSDEAYNKDFRYNNIYRSSLFSEFYLYEKENNIRIDKASTQNRIDILVSQFPCENITSNLIQDYLKWRFFYYGV